METKNIFVQFFFPLLIFNIEGVPQGIRGGRIAGAKSILFGKLRKYQILILSRWLTSSHRPISLPMRNLHFYEQ
jgi:hypothetical protein